jgi:phosphate transport system permease protein
LNATNLFFLLCLLGVLGFLFGRHRAFVTSHGSIKNLNSLPTHYGMYALTLTMIPALVLLAAWAMVSSQVIEYVLISELPPEMQSLPREELGLVINDVRNATLGQTIASDDVKLIRQLGERYLELQRNSNHLLWMLCLTLCGGGIAWAWNHIQARHPARTRVERVVVLALITCSLIAVLTTIGIVLSVIFESILFFEQIPLTEFLFGVEWSPQMAIRADQVGSSGAFGAVPLFTGTLLISGIAMLVAVPIGLMSSIYMAEYATRRMRSVLKPVLEILAGIPTVVYGFFAALTVAPMIRDFGQSVGLQVASESALAAGLVMGIMIIPFVSSISDDVISAVPRAMREGSYGLGATQSETIRLVIIPAALPGIVGGVLLAISRAIGETMIVVMAAGLSANLSANPLEAVTTVTVQIVTLLVGDQEFDSPKTLAAFALGLVLFLVTLVLNIIALHVVRRYREQYE